MKSEWVPFVKEKVEVQISERVGLTVVVARVFTREEDFNTRKEVLLDNLRHLARPETKNSGNFI